MITWQCRSKGRGRGGRAPPVFSLKSKNRPVLNGENKILSSNCLGRFLKNDLPMKSTFTSKATQTV